jgi:tRNA nucleotidyltransferase (CCA-adding enzyme)
VRPAGSGDVARWEHFAHDADIGVRGYGATPAEAFEQAAAALTAAVTNPATVATTSHVDVQCEAPDAELLLVDWLNALIYEMATRRMCFARFRVRIDGQRLTAHAWGEPVDPARHDLVVEPKGATYTALRVAPAADGTWVAQCVIDV